jgi:hypothetical protein
MAYSSQTVEELIALNLAFYERATQSQSPRAFNRMLHFCQSCLRTVHRDLIVAHIRAPLIRRLQTRLAPMTREWNEDDRTNHTDG